MREVIQQHTRDGVTYVLVTGGPVRCGNCAFHHPEHGCGGGAFGKVFCFGVGYWIALPSQYVTGANMYRIALRQTRKA